MLGLRRPFHPLPKDEEHADQTPEPPHFGAESFSDGEHDEFFEGVWGFRRDCCSRLVDEADNLKAAASRAKLRLTSHPSVVSGPTLSGRVAFIWDIVSDCLVATALINGGNNTLGGLVVCFVAVPYILVLFALLPFAQERLAEQFNLFPWAAALLWILGGIPGCMSADIYFNLRYLNSDPKHVAQSHYMTLRYMAELAQALPQLLLQSYIGLRQMNLCRTHPREQRASCISPLLLVCSIAASLCTAKEMCSKLQLFAHDQCGGNVWRFLWQISRLGATLAPSYLFDQLRSRPRVVIACDLRSIAYKEIRRLSIVTRRARQLEELIFEDASWIEALVSPYTSQAQVAQLVGEFALAPNLRLLEVQGEVEVPAWAASVVRQVARAHRSLQEVFLKGHEPIRGKFMRQLDAAHPLLRAAHQGNRTEIRRAERAPLETHAEALCLAASVGSLEVLRMLLLLPGGMEAMHLAGGRESGLWVAGDGAVPLHFAAAAGNWRAVELLVEARAELDCLDTNLKATPLWVAARDDRAEAVTALLAARAEVDKADTDGFTPLAAAAIYSSTLSIARLLAVRAQLNQVTNQGRTSVFLASEQDSVGSLRLLLEAAADPNKADSCGFAPVQTATHRNHVQSLQLLLSARANVNQTDEFGQTALELAAKHGHLECLELLLLARAQVNQADRDGETPLIMAARYGGVSCLEPLLQARADPHSVGDGQTAFGWAQRQEHEEAVRILRRHGANLGELHGVGEGL